MELLTVAYHYVDNEDKYSGGIYPTGPDRLEKQIELIGSTYSFITEDQLVAAIKGEAVLPEKACLMTFDDAVISQYEVALPILEKHHVPAVYYVPTDHLLGNAYAVHKAHYLLSQVKDEVLLADAEKHYEALVGKPVDWDAVGIGTIIGWYRYDTEAAAKFKYLINHMLDEDLAYKLITKTFLDHFDGTERDFCESFFINREQLRELDKHPLISIGLHTHRHMSVPKSSPETVHKDMLENYRILKEDVGISRIRGIGYPFGLLTQEVFEQKVEGPTHELGLVYGFTTEKKTVSHFDEPFRMGRFGPNDISGGKRPIFEI